MPDDLPVLLGDQRQTQLSTRTQCIHNELLGMAAVRGFAEGCLGECVDDSTVFAVSGRIMQFKESAFYKVMDM